MFSKCEEVAWLLATCGGFFQTKVCSFFRERFSFLKIWVMIFHQILFRSNNNFSNQKTKRIQISKNPGFPLYYIPLLGMGLRSTINQSLQFFGRQTWILREKREVEWVEWVKLPIHGIQSSWDFATLRLHPSPPPMETPQTPSVHDTQIWGPQNRWKNLTPKMTSTKGFLA